MKSNIINIHQNQNDKKRTKNLLLHIEVNDDDEIFTIDGEKYTVSEIIKEYTLISDMINHEIQKRK